MQRAVLGGDAERVVDLLDAGCAFCLDREVDDRAGGGRDADRDPAETAVELGDHEAERLRRAGGRRDEVQCGGARAAQVAVRTVEEVLIGGVGVDRAHLAVADADRLVQHLGDGRQAVGGARRVADDVVALGVVHLLEVHADHDSRVQRL